MSMEDHYDPHYRGALSIYLGTPFVRYLLIDPVVKTHTEGRLPRGALSEGITKLLGTSDITKVTMRMTTTS